MLRVVILSFAGLAFPAPASAQVEMHPVIETILFSSWGESEGPPHDIFDYRIARNACEVPLMDRQMEQQGFNNNDLIAAEPETRNAMGEYALIRDGGSIIRMRKGMFRPSVERITPVSLQSNQTTMVLAYEVTARWEDGGWTEIPPPTDALERRAGIQLMRVDLVPVGGGQVTYANLLDPYVPALVEQGGGMDTVIVRCGDLNEELTQLREGG